MSRIILILIFVSIQFFSCKFKTPYTDIFYFNQYCFDNKSSTDSLLVGLRTFPKNDLSHANFSKHIKIKQYHKVNIERISSSMPDYDIVLQFLYSMKIYNVCSSYKTGCTLAPYSLDLFFYDTYFNKKITTHIKGEEIVIINLSALNIYDFKYKLIEKINTDGKMEIDFGQGTKIICSEALHKGFVFPFCLNYISKNHKMINYARIPVEYREILPD